MVQWTRECRYLFQILSPFPLDKYPEVGLLGHTVVLFLTFWGNSILFSIMAKPIYTPTNKCTRVPSSPYPHQHLLLLVFFGWRRLLRVPWTVRRSNQSILMEINFWIFIGRTDAGADVPILWPLDAKKWLIRKDPDAGKDGRQKERGMTEDEMVGWYHWLDGYEFEQVPGVGDR